MGVVDTFVSVVGEGGEVVEGCEGGEVGGEPVCRSEK